jgi:hypothetical protein
MMERRVGVPVVGFFGTSNLSMLEHPQTNKVTERTPNVADKRPSIGPSPAICARFFDYSPGSYPER